MTHVKIRVQFINLHVLLLIKFKITAAIEVFPHLVFSFKIALPSNNTPSKFDS